MQLLALRRLPGPNVYSHRPVLRVRVDIGEYEDRPSCRIPGFVEGVLRLLPGLAEHTCSRGYAGGFEERLHEGTYLAHVFEHMVIELQQMAGAAVRFGKTRSQEPVGHYDVIVGAPLFALAEEAVTRGWQLLLKLLAGQPAEAAGDVAALTAIWQAGQLGPSTAALVAAAKERHIPVRQLGDSSLLLLGQAARQKRVWATLTSATSAIAVDIASDKQLTKTVLAEQGIPVPQGQVVRDAAAVWPVIVAFDGPGVVKPLTGNQGKGVTVEITDAASAAAAFTAAAAFDAAVLVEEWVAGRQYRLCVVNGQMVAAAERIPPQVTGDGRHSIKELVEQVNQQPERGEGHAKPLTRLVIDEVSRLVLAKQGVHPDFVPAAGQQVLLRENANLSNGATAVDVTADVHPATAEMAVRAAAAIGLDVAGVDVVIPDIRQPLTWGYGAIVEVNAAPGIRMHEHPSQGTPRATAQAIVNSLFPPGEDGRIPIIAITGTNGKTTVTRLIAHMLEQTGQVVGMTTTDGIYVGGKCLVKGDTTGPDSARLILQHPQVEIAVLETARGGIVRGGLAFDRCDVGIVTNVTEDHLGQDGIENLEDLAYIKALVPETVRPGGVALLNAEDASAPAMAARVKGEVAYFSLQADHPLIRRHLGAGGRAYFQQNGILYGACGAFARKLIAVDKIPIALGGIADHNVQNALIAAAAADCLGLPLKLIRQGLMSFDQNPGRLMLLPVQNFRVCVDYGHNPAGYQALLKTARCLGAKRLVGVIAAPGDRRDDVIRQIGRIAGQGFDYVYIKEDGDLRGRQPGETAELLASGLSDAGFDLRRSCIVREEAAAVRQALAEAKRDDLVVIFYEKYDTVLEVLQNAGQTGWNEPPALLPTAPGPVGL